MDFYLVVSLDEHGLNKCFRSLSNEPGIYGSLLMVTNRQILNLMTNTIF